MDQYPFEFKFEVAGLDVDYFIETLKNAGFENQAKEVEEQFNQQLNSL